MNQTTTSPAPARERSFLTLLPLFLAFLAFSPTLANDFAFWDDNEQIVRNPFVRTRPSLGHALSAAFRQDNAGYLLMGMHSSYYRPTMHLAYWLEYSLWGPTAWAFHLVNVLLHVLVTLLVQKLLQQLLPREAGVWSAPAGAALFAVHPLHTQVVAWLAAIPELLVTIFYLLAFLAYLRAERAAHRVRWVWLWSGAGLLFLACLSKEMAVTLPAMVTLHALFFSSRRQRTLTQRAAISLPFWSAAACYLLLRFWVLGGRLELARTSSYDWTTVIRSALSLYGRYWSKLVEPYPLSAAYPFQPTHSVWEPYLWIGLAILGAGLWWYFRGGKVAAWGVLWTTVTLLPVLNIRAFPVFPFSDHYAYLPSVGLSILLGAGLAHAWDRLTSSRAKLALGGAAAAMGLAFLGLSVARSVQWKDQVSLYSEALERVPDFPLHRPLAHALVAQGRWDEAMIQFREALTNPQGALEASDAHIGIAGVYFEQGNLEAAEDEIVKALQKLPDYYYPLFNLALIRARRGDLPAARRHIAHCLRSNPYFVEAYVLEGIIASGQGDRPAARRAFEQALRLDPGNADAAEGLAKVR